MEILDSQRFCRGVKVLKSHLDNVMVRRLKDDLRSIVKGFAERRVKQIDIDGLPDDTPELVLSRLLDQYRQVRGQRVAEASKRKQAKAALLISGLQQRLLSSIEAFARTRKVHRRTMEKLWSGEAAAQVRPHPACLDGEADGVLEASPAQSSRPHPARPDGEGDSLRGAQSERSYSPSRQAGWGLSSAEGSASSTPSHSPSAQGGWGLGASGRLELLAGDVDADDDRAELEEEELAAIEDAQFAASTESTAGETRLADGDAERRLLDQMQAVAEGARGLPDARVRYLIDWMKQNMCSGARLPGVAVRASRPPQAGGTPAPQSAAWTDLRLLIFTEYEDTKRYLVNMLRAAIAGTQHDEHRIEVFHGPTPPDKRDQIKRAFNKPPQEHPVRILIATDAAREGLNLQAHCWNLFHFDVPWNPSRLEQRNGRIDRKLQEAPEVFCHYFVYAQRPEDRVLQALVRKTKVIRQELGSLAEVLESRLSETLKGGIRHADADRMAVEIEDAGLDPQKRATTEEELEASRQRQNPLCDELKLLERRVDDARKWIGLDEAALQDALSCSLERMGAERLNPGPAAPAGQPPRFVFPNLESRVGGDPSWATTLDTLRPPPEDGRRNFAWRRENQPRPVVFAAPKGMDESVVQLHLQHRVVQRLLSRFIAKGFVDEDLSRACLAQSQDNVPRVVLLGRLSIYGAGAARLHDEVLTVTARWIEPEKRGDGLKPYARDAEARTLEMLESSLSLRTRERVPGAGVTAADSLSLRERAGVRAAGASARFISESTAARLLSSLPADMEELLPHLRQRGEAARETAEAALAHGTTTPSSLSGW